MANFDDLKGSWTELRGTVRQKWGKLTDDDLDQIRGNGEKLIGRIQQKYGIKKEEARRQVQEFLQGEPAGKP